MNLERVLNVPLNLRENQVEKKAPIHPKAGCW